MRGFRIALPLALSLAALTGVATRAHESEKKLDPPAESATNQSNFCYGEFALCITAPCAPIPTLDRLGNYYVTSALCECDVVKGWSMGPGSCRDRGPAKSSNGYGRTFLISTYSNDYNGQTGSGDQQVDNRVLRCDDTVWAWCYGAPCVVDDEDSDKALCTCPVTQSTANLLGDCDSGMCDQIWSAAVPAGDCFANWNYYDWMTANGFETKPPANRCGAADQPVCSKAEAAASSLE